MPRWLHETAYSRQVSNFRGCEANDDFFDRGGVAVVWLGKKDGANFAMKQFPKNGTGPSKFDQSAYVELQMAQLIRTYSTVEERE